MGGSKKALFDESKLLNFDDPNRSSPLDHINTATESGVPNKLRKFVQLVSSAS